MIERSCKWEVIVSGHLNASFDDEADARRWFAGKCEEKPEKHIELQFVKRELVMQHFSDRYKDKE